MPALSAAETDALLLSLRVGLVSTVISLPPALAVATLLARRDFPGKTLLDSVVHLPLVLPPVVVGYVLLLLLGTQGPIGAWLGQTFGIVVALRWTGAAGARLHRASGIVVACGWRGAASAAPGQRNATTMPKVWSSHAPIGPCVP